MARSILRPLVVAISTVQGIHEAVFNENEESDALFDGEEFVPRDMAPFGWSGSEALLGDDQLDPRFWPQRPQPTDSRRIPLALAEEISQPQQNQHLPAQQQQQQLPQYLPPVRGAAAPQQVSFAEFAPASFSPESLASAGASAVASLPSDSREVVAPHSVTGKEPSRVANLVPKMKAAAASSTAVPVALASGTPAPVGAAGAVSEARFGAKECKCIGFGNVKGKTTVVLPMKGGALRKVPYPADLGAHCDRWDLASHPNCKDVPPASQPSFCSKKWCFVSPDSCVAQFHPGPSTYLPNVTFRGHVIQFSYETCGATRPSDGGPQLHKADVDGVTLPPHVLKVTKDHAANAVAAPLGAKAAAAAPTAGAVTTATPPVMPAAKTGTTVPMAASSPSGSAKAASGTGSPSVNRALADAATKVAMDAAKKALAGTTAKVTGVASNTNSVTDVPGAVSVVPKALASTLPPTLVSGPTKAPPVAPASKGELMAGLQPSGRAPSATAKLLAAKPATTATVAPAAAASSMSSAAPTVKAEVPLVSQVTSPAAATVAPNKASASAPLVAATTVAASAKLPASPAKSLANDVVPATGRSALPVTATVVPTAAVVGTTAAAPVNVAMTVPPNAKAASQAPSTLVDADRSKKQAEALAAERLVAKTAEAAAKAMAAANGVGTDGTATAFTTPVAPMTPSAAVAMAVKQPTKTAPTAAEVSKARKLLAASQEDSVAPKAAAPKAAAAGNHSAFVGLPSDTAALKEVSAKNASATVGDQDSVAAIAAALAKGEGQTAVPALSPAVAVSLGSQWGDEEKAWDGSDFPVDKQEIFGLLDVDGDGRISEAELLGFFRSKDSDSDGRVSLRELFTDWS